MGRSFPWKAVWDWHLVGKLTTDHPLRPQPKAARADGQVSILRAGWSAIEPHTWIKPHFGMTNTKIKLHLGVIVPEVSHSAILPAARTLPARKPPHALPARWLRVN